MQTPKDSFTFKPQALSQLLQIKKIQERGQSAALETGDILVQMVKEANLPPRGCRRFLLALSDELGIPYVILHQRYWVATRFPPSHPGRAQGLSYSHIRLLAALPDSDREELAKRASEERLTVTQLKALVQTFDTNRKPAFHEK